MKPGELFPDHHAENTAQNFVITKRPGELHDRYFCRFQATPTRQMSAKLIPTSRDRPDTSTAEIVMETIQEEFNTVLDEWGLFYHVIHKAVEL